MRTKLRSKVTLLFMTLGMLLAFAGVALADTITADPNPATLVVVENNVSKAPGETGSAKVWLTVDDNSTDPVNGCNANDSNPVSITLSSSSSDVTFDSSGTKANPASLTACGSAAGKEIGYTVSSSATGPFPKTVTVTASGSGGRVVETSCGPQCDQINLPAYTSDTFTVTITAPPNTAPAIASNNASVTVNEGQTATNSGTWSDANAGDTVNLSASVGSVVKSGTNASGTWAWSYATTDGPDNSQTVTITANDGKGGVTNTTFPLTVNNVAPTTTLAAANPLSVDESSTAKRTYNYSIVDPGADTVKSVSTLCGDNGVKGSDSSGSFECIFDDGTKQSTVSAKATDSDDAAGNNATQTVNIANVAPTATLGNNGPVDEGSSANISFSSQTDPSGADTTAGFHYAYRCDGTAFTTAPTYAGAGSTASTTCSFDDNGLKAVRAAIIDKDDGVTEVMTTVTVKNVAPTITNIAASVQNALVNKNVIFTGTATDPSSADTTAGFFWQWSKDGGVTYTPSALPNPFAASGNPFTTSFADCGSHSVSAKASDKDAGTSAAVSSSSVDVYNASFSPPVDVAPYLNTVQKGRVIPVKISVGCPSGLTGLQPSIQLFKGDFTDGNESATDEIETYSVSSADSGVVMRAVDGGYIYNLRVPDVANTLYTIRVNPFGGNNASSNMYALLKTRK